MTKLAKLLKDKLKIALRDKYAEKKIKESLRKRPELPKPTKLVQTNKKEEWSGYEI